MPMRSELSVPAMRANWRARETKFSWPKFSWSQNSEILRTPDVTAILIFVAIGLVAAVSLTLLFPLPDYIVAALAPVS
jgi:hypothetical protein